MQSRHAQLHQALAVLAPPKRFELLVLTLSGVERSVSQLAAAVRLSQSCTTRHLQALERAGLVKGVRDGKCVVFRPAPRDAAAEGVLASLADAAPLASATARWPGASSRPSLPRAARRPPAMRRPHPQRRQGTPDPGVDPDAAQPASESGNNGSTTGPPAGFTNELEDFLL